MLEKKSFESDIASLRNGNADLNLLRTQLTALKSNSNPKRPIGSKEMAVVKRISRVRLASGMLHDTLRKSWSCLDTGHLRHFVKLCVESKAEVLSGTVTLDMAMSYEISHSQRYDNK